MSKTIAFLSDVIISMRFKEGGLSVLSNAVHHKYSPVSVSVKVILPVYYPLSSGLISIVYTSFLLAPIVMTAGPDAPIKSVSTS